MNQTVTAAQPDPQAVAAFEQETRLLRTRILGEVGAKQADYAPTPAVETPQPPAPAAPVGIIPPPDPARYPNRQALGLVPHPMFLGLQIDDIGQPIPYRFIYACDFCGERFAYEWSNPEINPPCRTCGKRSSVLLGSAWIGRTGDEGLAQQEILRLTPGEVVDRWPAPKAPQDPVPVPGDLPEFLRRKPDAPENPAAPAGPVASPDPVMLLLQTLDTLTHTVPGFRTDVPSLMMLFEQVIQQVETGQDQVIAKAAPTWAWNIIYAMFDGDTPPNRELWLAANAMGWATSSSDPADLAHNPRRLSRDDVQTFLASEDADEAE